MKNNNNNKNKEKLKKEIKINFGIYWDVFVPIVPEIYKNHIFLHNGNIRCQ